MKKPRNKKYNRKDKEARLYTELSKSALSRFAIIGSTISTPAILALSHTSVSATRASLEVVADVVVAELLEEIRPWYVWMMFVYEDIVDGVAEITPECIVGKIDDANLSDFTDNRDRTIAAMLPDDRTPIAHAYWFSPYDTYDLDEMCESLEGWWMSAGIDLPEKQLPEDKRMLAVRDVNAAILRRNTVPFKIKKHEGSVAVAKE